MKWINLTGLLLQFIAFWLAAPELLGQEALKRFEKGLVSFISTLPSILMGLLGIGFGASMAFYGISEGLKAAEGAQTDIVQTMVLIAMISVILMVYFLVFAKRTQKWMKRKFAEPLMTRLIENNESRKQALIVAAVLFSIGFLLQVVAIALT